MRKKLKRKAITAFSVGLLALSHAGIACDGQILVTTNSETVPLGEELSMIVTINGTGRCDVYAAVTGGIFPEGVFQAFNVDNGLTLTPWKPGDPEPPVKLLDNVDIGNLPIEERVIRIFPRLQLSESFPGDYILYGALTTPGQLDFDMDISHRKLDMIPVTLTKD